MTFFRPISVGACGDPSSIINSLGNTVAKPCQGLCTTNDAHAWRTAAADLRAKIVAAWTSLLAVEAQHGVTSQQLKFFNQRREILLRYEQEVDEVMQFTGTTSVLNAPVAVASIVKWMPIADCFLGELETVLAQYKSGTPPRPTPVPTPVPSPSPAGQAPATSSPSTTMIVGAILLAGLGAYFLLRPQI